MAVPRSNYDPRRVCLNPFPEIDFGKYRRTVGVYIAGGLVRSPLYGSFPTQLRPQFALANWLFLDACIVSAHAKAPWGQPDTPVPVHVSIVDWIPGICSLLGFLVINLIDKDRVRGEDTFGDARAVWRARLFLFIGFALMAGGLAGSVVRLVSPYIPPPLMIVSPDGAGHQICCPRPCRAV
jgi:hypothetical protein